MLNIATMWEKCDFGSSKHKFFSSTIKKAIIKFKISFSIKCILIFISLLYLPNAIELSSLLKTGSFQIGNCMIIVNQSSKAAGINFFLYTNNRKNDPELIVIDEFNNSNIANTSFNANYPTKILIHGYNSDMFLYILVDIKNQYFEKGNYNIIMIDWNKLSRCYISSIINSRNIGQCIATFINGLHDINATDIHLIGFSLGAHIAGFAANSLQPYKLPRITGLDPALPLFIFADENNKLDSSDAEFVDIWHSSAFLSGKAETLGHVDFFLNGGINQPGCWTEENFFACLHHRAGTYFAEAITRESGFLSWSCDSYHSYLFGMCSKNLRNIIIGDNINKSIQGVHIVLTEPETIQIDVIDSV